MNFLIQAYGYVRVDVSYLHTIHVCIFALTHVKCTKFQQALTNMNSSKWLRAIFPACSGQINVHAGCFFCIYMPNQFCVVALVKTNAF